MAEEVGALVETKLGEKGFSKPSVLTYMDNLNTQIGELKKKVRELEEAPAPVKETVKTVVDDAKVKQLTQQVEAEHGARIKEKQLYETEKVALNNKIAELTKNITMFSQELEKAKKLLAQSQEQNISQAGKGNAATAELTALQNEINVKNSQIDNLTKNIEDIEYKLSDANSKLTEAEKSSSDAKKTIAKKDTEIEELKARAEKAEKAAPMDISNIDISNVSPIVQQILDGAQSAAEQAKRDAAKDAENIRQQADEYSKKTRTDADDYSSKCRSDADGYAIDKQGDADKYAAKARSDADIYCEDKVSKSEKLAKETVDKAKSDANKIIDDARKEARKTKEDSERQSLDVASAVKDIKVLLKNQLMNVDDTISRISSSLNTLSADAAKIFEKSKNATDSALKGLEDSRINDEVGRMNDIKNGKASASAPKADKSSVQNDFDLKELAEAAETGSKGFGATTFSD